MKTKNLLLYDMPIGIPTKPVLNLCAFLSESMLSDDALAVSSGMMTPGVNEKVLARIAHP